ncbi:MAG: MFS transporter [Actinobacteria bacterium]|nr:MAG: MFS transporter [Actinomycetota bacterium]
MLAVRWISQGMDGLYQTALASFVLFSPEKQATAGSAATAFAIMLLPYSFLGPFVGTILDRFPRRQIIFFANTFRALDLLLVALVTTRGKSDLLLVVVVLFSFGANRLILAGLSAGLPRVIDPTKLIESNAIAVTGGSIAIVLGGGLGYGLRAVLEHFQSLTSSDSILVAVAALGYFLSALFSLRLKREELGPTEHELVQSKSVGIFSAGVLDLKLGLSHLQQHRDATLGMIAVAVQRGGITALVVTSLLLERNTFHDPNNPDAGLAGLVQLVSAAGVGVFAGAVIAPWATRKFGRHRWIRMALVLSAAFVPTFIWGSHILLAFAAFSVAGFGQSVKVTCDALVQESISDEFRGRVFSIYDVLVNAAIVGGAGLAALLVPTSGRSIILPLVVVFEYLVMAFLLKGFSKPITDSVDSPSTTS